MKLEFQFKYSRLKKLVCSFSVLRVDINDQTLLKSENEIKNKVFCIGFGKTGTTSLGAALHRFGYKLGNQAVGEMFAEDWHKNRLDRILNFCETADAFQDIPFAMPNLYKELAKNYPNAKFILTVRKNKNVWFDSLVSFHAKKYAVDKTSVPTSEELGNSMYRYKGYALDTKKYIFNYPDVALYDKDKYCGIYESHNKEVISFFENQPNDLLVLDVSEKDSYQKLAKFLGKKVDQNDQFPWKNKTSQI